MLAAGVTVALGSDGTNGRHDVPRMAYLAAMMFKEVRAKLPMITAHTALEMATIHGARALGMHNQVGSLETGKRADLVIHTLDRPEPHPRFDPVDNLIYFSLSRTVDTVIVDGRIIFDHGQFTLIDAQQAYARIDACGQSVKNRIGTKVPSPWPIIE
jgi:cytosine/adenosine deaminase-related metal-dependent hydrolase